jgi:imidazole glycerol-phosphate synthase subunit HisF
MLKKRVIATVLLKKGIVVQSIGFNKFLPIGKLKIVIEYLERWDIDEIVILDIGKSKGEAPFDKKEISDALSQCFIPVAIGGGIKSIQEIKDALRIGADKVVINSGLFDNYSFLKDASGIFGRQCIIAGVDVTRVKSQYTVTINSGAVTTDILLEKYLQLLEQNGAGEILINSIDDNGKKCGFNIDLIDTVLNQSGIPIIAVGGAGSGHDFLNAFSNTTVDALAAGNMFHFSEHSVVALKSFLKNGGIDIRINDKYNYDGYDFHDNRIIKVADAVL